MAPSAPASAAATPSGDSAATSTGSYCLFGADITFAILANRTELFILRNLQIFMLNGCRVVLSLLSHMGSGASPEAGSRNVPPAMLGAKPVPWGFRGLGPPGQHRGC